MTTKKRQSARGRTRVRVLAQEDLAEQQIQPAKGDKKKSRQHYRVPVDYPLWAMTEADSKPTNCGGRPSQTAVME